MDTFYKNSNEKLVRLDEGFERLKNNVIDNFGEVEGKRRIQSAKWMVNGSIKFMKQNFSKKLVNLRQEKGQRTNHFQPSNGSRKVIGYDYKKKDIDGAFSGAPFPRNLRPSRRSRPHRITTPPQRFTPTTEDLEARNPVIVSKQNAVISEAGKIFWEIGSQILSNTNSPS